MSQSDNPDEALAADARFGEALARVAFEPGMLLGVAATRAEQDYHRRRLNRHDYWLHGAGTVCGLAVSADAEDPGNDSDEVPIRLLVGPGVGIDGLGRQVTVHEPYCIELDAWLRAAVADGEHWDALIRDGLAGDDRLWLKVTMRAEATASGLQPVMAHAPNAGTDPVAPSRLQDCVLLELVAERPADAAAGFSPFAAHGPLPAEVDDRLSEPERAAIDGAAGNARAQLQLAARLLHLLPPDNTALALADDDQATRIAAARVLLARLELRLDDDREPVANPRRLGIDNLARPFVLNPMALAWLARAGDGDSG